MPDPAYVRDAFARIADRYVLTNHVLSCGADLWWRHVVTSRIRQWQPARLLDVASGTGDLALKIQRSLPACEVIASDFCAEMLAHAARRGVRQTLVADALALPFGAGEFDVVTVAFGLRNMADYPTALAGMCRVLKPGGHLVILDFSLPTGFMRHPYRFYLHRILPHLAGWLTGEQDTYEYLGGSIEAFPAGPAMTALLESCGFGTTSCTPLTCGVVTLYEGTKGHGERPLPLGVNSISNTAPAPVPISKRPPSWRASAETSCRPNDVRSSGSKAGGKPVPLSATRKRSPEPPATGWSPTHSSPRCPAGNACLSALETNSLTSRPQGMAWSISSRTGHRSKCS